MDIKAIVEKKIDEIVNKVKNDKDFSEKFKSNPIKAVEDVLGIDLPDDKIEAIVSGVRVKLGISDVNEAVDTIKSLFKK